MSSLHTLTDRARDIWVDQFTLTPAELGLAAEIPWSIHKRTLKGGASHGVDLIEVDNGALRFSILPTRGMGIWKGHYRGIDLGWKSPVVGPVHPSLVELSGRHGLGWLTGFDEWLCRCGLSWMGPPGEDHGFPLTLHGRIANSPAFRVEVGVQREAPHALRVFGQVEEGGLFYPHLRLSTTLLTHPGSNTIQVCDVIENRSAQPAEMQILYHCNNGPPLLEAGSRVRIPIREVFPLTDWAAEGMGHWDALAGPVAGFAEQVYGCHPAADASGQSLALLHDAAGAKGLVLRWPVSSLPCFTLWKNTAALEDGYVAGLEPATGFPYFRERERAEGRVVTLPPGGTWEARWSLAVLDSAEQVRAAVEEIEAIQRGVEPRIQRTKR